MLNLLLEKTELLAILMNFISTFGGVFVGAYCTYLLYNREKKDKEIGLKKELEVQEVRAANELIIHLWAALSDCMVNSRVINKQRQYFSVPEPKDLDKNIYVIENNSDWDTVKRTSNMFIDVLPCLSLHAVMLEEMFNWSKIYRDRRNKCIKTQNKEEYTSVCDSEYNINVNLIRALTCMLLVVYDYAIFKWKRQYIILKIPKRKAIINVWRYLGAQFTRSYIQKNMQYRFQNPALVKWFFKILKNKYKQLQETKNKHDEK